MTPLFAAVLYVVDLILNFYFYVVLGTVIISWLRAFNVINFSNRFVYQVATVLDRLTEPALRPLRRVLPNFGGIDFSPMVLVLAILFLQRLLHNYMIYLTFSRM